VIYGLVMAAGASRRFGEIKQLAKIDGVPMALRSYNILNRANMIKVKNDCCSEGRIPMPIVEMDINKIVIIVAFFLP